MTRPSVPGRSANAHRLAIEVARGRLSTVVDGVQEQPVLLTRRGRPVAAVITVEQYEMLLAAEERLRRRTRPSTVVAESGPITYRDIEPVRRLEPGHLNDEETTP